MNRIYILLAKDSYISLYQSSYTSWVHIFLNAIRTDLLFTIHAYIPHCCIMKYFSNVYYLNTTKWNNHINCVMCSLSWVKSQFTPRFDDVYLMTSRCRVHVVYLIWTLYFLSLQLLQRVRLSGHTTWLAAHATWHTVTCDLAAIQPDSWLLRPGTEHIRPGSHTFWQSFLLADDPHLLEQARAFVPFKLAEPILVTWCPRCKTLHSL